MSEEKPVASRKDRPTGSMHVGDSDFDVNDPAYEMDATWGEVCTACCVKSPAEWGMAFLGLFGCLFFLYFFLLGLNLLGSGAKVMGGCAAGALFGDDMNPIAGLMVGIVATVLLQSSSTRGKFAQLAVSRALPNGEWPFWDSLDVSFSFTSSFLV
mmetsp:Transcript_14838/g.35944  ORF Transcript_14838/g.35944 Transcript_14838/m.35944 type:complete len:155 (+) Transcript_14838:1490-1954(+)